MDTPLFDEASEKGTSTFEKIESEWKLIEGGAGDIGLYLRILDKFLMAYYAPTDLSLAGIEALNERYLQLLHPNGKDNLKRDPSLCTKEEIQSIGLDPESIRTILGEKSLSQSSAVVEDFNSELKGVLKKAH
ncbi:hypothetical protein KBC86_03800 [Candidatus Gracilibacteria bacterium]|nr:hypothetical protein [Candidatus Gracilibacteria bacterium]